MRTDDPLDLSEYYAQRGRVLQELGALRDFARLRNRREWQWRDRGTATAGNGGTATAGVRGVISILFYDSRLNKHRRLAAEVGVTPGIEPGKKYRVESGRFVEVVE